VVLFLTVPLQAPWRHANYVVLPPPDTSEAVVFVPGTQVVRAQGGKRTPTDSSARHERSRQAAIEIPLAAAVPPAAVIAATAPPSAAASPPDTAPPTMPAYDPNASSVAPEPQVGDGRLWVSPRPALPGSVAAVLYGDTTERREAAVERLRAMVDSLNQILDQVQRERQRPKWTVGGTPEKPQWGIDSAFIHVAGVKIPTAVLAALGNLLPPGNFDEDQHIKQLNYMREDILQAADRAQSLQEFKRYVHELRDRRQAEHDADDRRHGQDTVKAVP
jgi:hypothetical protein